MSLPLAEYVRNCLCKERMTWYDYLCQEAVMYRRFGAVLGMGLHLRSPVISIHFPDDQQPVYDLAAGQTYKQRNLYYTTIKEHIAMAFIPETTTVLAMLNTHPKGKLLHPLPSTFLMVLSDKLMTSVIVPRDQ